MRRPAASREASAGRIVVPVLAMLAIGVVAALSLAEAMADDEGLTTTVVQDGLDHPWDIAFTDDGRMLVTERVGRVRVYASGEPHAALLSTTDVPDVRAELESGLMGITVVDDRVFVCASRDPDGDAGDPWRVELLAATLDADSSLTAFRPVPGISATGAARHQGCAVELGAGYLWVTIGDANLPGADNRAQDPGSLNGKVLRIEPDGSIPPDNPVGPESPVYSLGHRNPQGIAIRPDGLVLEVEHGTDENDEINAIAPGGNYGYPCRTGVDAPGPIPEACDASTVLDAPRWASGSPTLATSGATFLVGSSWGEWAGNLIVSTLKEEDLRRFAVGADGSVTAEGTLLDGRFGRLRALVIGPGGALYVSSSNGSGDRIVRVERDRD